MIASNTGVFRIGDVAGHVGEIAVRFRVRAEDFHVLKTVPRQRRQTADDPTPCSGE